MNPDPSLTPPESTPSERAAILNRLCLQNALLIAERDPDVRWQLALESLALNERMAAVCGEILKEQQARIAHLRALLGLGQKGRSE